MTASTRYDCIIVGGGVTGTALLYELAKFTDLTRLCLLEQGDRPAQGNSHVRNNSQTLRSGDIETEYGLEKAPAAKRAAYMVINYATKLPPRDRDRIIQRMPKMVLGVGSEECSFIRRRHESFRGIYPRMRLLEAQDIADIEPNVALVDGSWRKDEIVASGTADEYCAVDFLSLSESFSAQCVRMDRGSDKQITQLYGTEVTQIRRDGADYVLETGRGLMQARSVVVCAGSRSLGLAQELGLGLEYGCLPLAGSYYFAPDVLNGKVYRVRDPRLPFAAIHGDRDIKERGKTRFGPTTTVMLPESLRDRRTSGHDRRGHLALDPDLTATLWDLMKESGTRNQVLRNVCYETPGLNRYLFVTAIRGIVPGIKARDLEFAEGTGGIRPQLVDRRSRKLRVGQTKISDGQAMVFNVTPSPGGTNCLGNAEQDMRMVAEHLGARIDWQAFEDALLTGYEDARGDLSELAEAG